MSEKKRTATDGSFDRERASSAARMRWQKVEPASEPGEAAPAAARGDFLGRLEELTPRLVDDFERALLRPGGLTPTERSQALRLVMARKDLEAAQEGPGFKYLEDAYALVQKYEEGVAATVVKFSDEHPERGLKHVRKCRAGFEEMVSHLSEVEAALVKRIEAAA